MPSQVKKSIKRVQADFQFGLEDIWREALELPRLSRSEIVWHHVSAAWSSFVASPLTTLVTTLTMSLSLFLFAALLLFRSNALQYFDAPAESLQLRIFLKESATAEQQKQLRQALQEYPGIAIVRFITKEEAFREFESQLGEQSGILEGLEGENPLPASFEIKSGSPSENLELFPEIARVFRDHPAVELIQYRQGLVQKLEKLVRLLQQAGFVAILFALVLTAGIITSAIRLAVYARRTEIEIMKLVGATDQFIRAPFLIEGFFQGLVGSLLSLVFLYVFYSGAVDFLKRSDLSQYVDIQLTFLSPFSVVAIIIVGTAIGSIGSFLAVKHFERES